MTTTYSIYPSIGIARVGNSPEWFLGPELVGDRPNPPGGFKDDLCRVKRQAARFRIFAHLDDGTAVEVSAADHEIQWSVHVANAKAAHPKRGNDGPAPDLTIDPGRKRIDGPAAQVALDGGSITFLNHAPVPVSLGELRTDGAARLYVLGGHGAAGSPTPIGMADYWLNPWWWDDLGDGPVSARLRPTGATRWRRAEPAWIVIAPPKFAPHQDSVTTLYDRLMQEMVAAGVLPLPATTSYTRDVHPILQRARDIRWVRGIANTHSNPARWAEPVTAKEDREYIFSFVTAPAARASAMSMPALQGQDGRVTPLQYHHLKRWVTGAFDDDWQGLPGVQWPIDPDGLTRAALEACVGGPFHPGIEVGALPVRGHDPSPLLDATNYVEPFRLDVAKVRPGDVTRGMAVPWQADFQLCTGTWWPVPRPASVYAPSDTMPHAWSKVNDYAGMVRTWHRLGFVVDEGDRHVERAVCHHPVLVPRSHHLVALGAPDADPATVDVTFDVVDVGDPETDVSLAVDRSRRVRGGASRAVRSAGGRIRRVTVPVEVDRDPRVTGFDVAVVRDRSSGGEWAMTIAVPPGRQRPGGPDGEPGETSHGSMVHERAAGQPIATIAHGQVPVGLLHRVPVFVTELADNLRVVVQTAAREPLDIRLQSPGGRLIEPWTAVANERAVHRREPGATEFGLRMPFGPDGREEHAGVWHVLVRQGEPREAPSPGTRDGIDTSVLEGMGAGGIGRPAMQPSRGAMADGPVAAYALLGTLTGGPTLIVEARPARRSIALRVMAQAATGIELRDLWVETRDRRGAIVDHELAQVDDTTFEGDVPALRVVDGRCRIRLRGASPAGFPLFREAIVFADHG